MTPPTRPTRPWSPPPTACARCGSPSPCSASPPSCRPSSWPSPGRSRCSATRVHNAADALTAVPLGVAFLLGRRAPTRRYTYGYGRAEDLAGHRHRAHHRRPPRRSPAGPPWTGCCTRATSSICRPWPPPAVVGFLGNEWVARYRIRVGRAIGSAALVADGLHARTDGFTSLAVLLSAGGAALGWRLGRPARRPRDHRRDPAGAARRRPRGLPAADGRRRPGPDRRRRARPARRHRASRTSASCGCAGSATGCAPRSRSWSTPSLTVREAHGVAVDAEHALLHAVPRLTAALSTPTRPRPADPPIRTPRWRTTRCDQTSLTGAISPAVEAGGTGPTRALTRSPRSRKPVPLRSTWTRSP